MYNFKNKIVLITGSTSGIGKATALEFAKLDAKLVVTGKTDEGMCEVQELCQKASPSDYKPITIVADFNKDTDVEMLMKKTIEHYKILDILVNNAGIVAFGNIENSSLDQFDLIMKINLRSAFYLTYLAIPHLKKSRGSIVNVSSIASYRPVIQFATYSISKAGVDQLTNCCALELAKYGIRINSVNPGIIKTNISINAGQTKERYEQILSENIKVCPLGRHGLTSDVASAILFLADNTSSSFITGEHL
ncbi:hypothetical protein A3Q56_07277, partial [Intoshia linei]